MGCHALTSRAADRQGKMVSIELLALNETRGWRFDSTRYECIELIAVQIAKVGGVEPFAPRARGTSSSSPPKVSASR